MLIRDVLAHKGTRVIGIWANKSLKDALGLLEERNISSAVVINFENRPIGLVTDRRLLSAVARHEARAFELSVADVMMTPPPTTALETTVAAAMRQMTDERVRHLVVMDGSRLAGVVSIGDLVKCRLDDFEAETKVLRDLALAQLSTE
ncbi:MAG: hypothetical protein RLZ98_93 [Pseudomonadota bacterium]|jgi:CBS domain-containing protein